MKFLAAILATAAAAATASSDAGDICTPKDYEATGATANADKKAAWDALFTAADVTTKTVLADLEADQVIETRWSAGNKVCTSIAWDAAVHTLKAPATADTSCDTANQAATQTASLTAAGSHFSGTYMASDTASETNIVAAHCFTAADDISELKDVTEERTRQTYTTGTTTVDTTKDLKFTTITGQAGGSLLLWLFIILLLGGGGGAAYYFMVIAPTM